MRRVLCFRTDAVHRLKEGCVWHDTLVTCLHATTPYCSGQARRREGGTSIVTSGMRVVLGPRDGKWFVEATSLCFGGMAPTTVAAPKTEVRGALFAVSAAAEFTVLSCWLCRWLFVVSFRHASSSCSRFGRPRGI